MTFFLGDFPAFPVFLLNVLISRWAIDSLEVFGIPLQGFTRTIRHIAQQDGFGQRTGVIEIARSR